MRHHAAGGAPPRPSQRHLRTGPRVLTAPTFRPGDRVRWNSRYRGTILELIGDEALVAEENPLLGGQRQWRLELAVLTRMPGR
jgi:hypothetical protein